MSFITNIIILGILLFTFIFASKGHVFLAVSKLKLLSGIETNLTEALRNYVEKCNTNGQIVSGEVVTFLGHMNARADTISQPGYIENPINAFHFIQRMNNQWQNVDATIEGDECPLTDPCHQYVVKKNTIRRSVGESVVPDDVRYAALGLVRLWHTYKLDLLELYRGKIMDTQTDPLTVDDILYICTQLDEDKEYYKELEWLNALLLSINTNHHDPETLTSYRQAAKATAALFFRNNAPSKSIDIINKALEVDPESKSLNRDLEFYQMKASETSETPVSILPPETDIEKSHYESLCRGGGKRSRKLLSKLRCLYRETKVPIYRAKEEIYSISPRLSVFYDVITEKEMQFVKETGIRLLMPSLILRSSDGKPNSADYSFRVSETGWMKDSESPVVAHLSQRVQLITGLSTQQFDELAHAEAIQILNYGIGGMYTPHLDPLGNAIDGNPYRETDPDYLKNTGDRIATWMFYLNDVKTGGGTVFTKLNVTVPVVKGSAAFWYNYKRSGELDQRTRHAGCPVLLGSKWVVNKWIRQIGQIFNRKCGKTVNAIDTPL